MLTSSSSNRLFGSSPISRKTSIELLKEARRVQDEINTFDNAQQALVKRPLVEALPPEVMIMATVAALRAPSNHPSRQKMKEIAASRNFMAQENGRYLRKP